MRFNPEQVMLIRGVSICNKEANVAAAAQHFSKFVFYPWSLLFVFPVQNSGKMKYFEKLSLRNCLWTRWHEVVQVYCKAIERVYLLLRTSCWLCKTPSANKSTLYYVWTTRNCMEMHCFLCRQLQNTVCKITNLCGTIYPNTFTFCALKMSLRDKLCVTLCLAQVWETHCKVQDSAYSGWHLGYKRDLQSHKRSPPSLILVKHNPANILIY